MNEHGKSDKPILPEKSTNKAGKSAAEGTEGRGMAKENLRQQNAFPTQGREDVHSALERVRQAARKNKETRFTALFHCVYDLDMLEYAYSRLKKDAAPGVDGETWQHYAEDLEQNLQDLSHRLQRGAYRAKPVRRTYIPKSDGRQRPLGVTALEDKIVQKAAVEVLNAIYEVDFVDFSYGLRPGRSQHNALDQLYLGIQGEFCGTTANDPTHAGEANGGQHRATAAHAYTSKGAGAVVESGSGWPFPLLRCARQ